VCIIFPEKEVFIYKRLFIIKIRNMNDLKDKVGMKNIKFSMFNFATGKVAAQLTNSGQKTQQG
jgi:hypothetical protein